MKGNLKHIEQAGEHTLCGYACDEVDIYFGEDSLDKEGREQVESWRQNKIEFGSNCKECIRILRELRAIKK